MSVDKVGNTSSSTSNWDLYAVNEDQQQKKIKWFNGFNTEQIGEILNGSVTTPSANYG